MIQTLFFEDFNSQSFNFLPVPLDSLPCLFSAMVDDFYDLSIDFCARLFTINIVTFSVNRCVIGKAFTHSVSDHHWSGDIPNFLQIIGCATWDLYKIGSTSLKKCSSAALPPRITQIWSISCLLFISVDSLGRYCANPNDPLDLGTIVIFSKGEAPSENHATTAWPASW